MNLSDISLTLLFTSNVSLKEWARIGNLEREIEIYKQLTRHLKQVNFITYGGLDDYAFEQQIHPIYLLPTHWYGPNRRTAFRIIVRHFPTLLNTNVFKTNQIKGATIAVWLKKIFRKKLILRCGYLHSRFTELKYKDERLIQSAYNLEYWAFAEADMGIVTSERDRQQVIEKYKMNSEKIRVIPNYVNTNVFLPMPQTHKEFDLGCVAKADPEKNLNGLLDALLKLREKGKMVRLMLIGRCSKDKTLISKVKEHRLAVTFKGDIPNYELPIYLNKTKVFILPSFFEGHPKALLEAMSCGLPCIGTDVEGIREDIRHQETGYLCNTDPQSIARAIQNVLDNSALQHRIGENARTYVVNNYSIEKILKMELDILQEVVSR